MKNKKVVLVSGLAVGLLISGFVSTSQPILMDSVNASEKEEKQEEKQASKIYSNSDEDKKELLNKMINSIDYFKTASGFFRYYSENAGTDMNVEFVVDIENSKSYEKNTFNNLINENITDPFEESIYNGQYYFVYSSDDYIAGENQASQVSYRHVSIPESLKANNAGVSSIEDRIDLIDGEEAYVKKFDSSLMGITKTVLLPEDFAIGFMGTDLKKWEIVSNEKFLDRDCVVVESALNSYYKDKHQARVAKFVIDSATGILLESHLYDDGNETFITQIHSLTLNEVCDSRLFDKYNDYIK